MTNEQKKTVEDNLPLVYSIINKFHFKNEDYIDLGLIGLIKGVMTYDPNKGYCISTYLSSCINNKIYNYYRLDKNPKTTSLDKIMCDENLYNKVMSTCEGPEVIVEKQEENRMLYDNLKLLSPSQRFVIINYYGLYNQQKISQKKLAEQLHVSATRVNRLHLSAIEKLRKVMKDVK